MTARRRPRAWLLCWSLLALAFINGAQALRGEEAPSATPAAGAATPSPVVTGGEALTVTATSAAPAPRLQLERCDDVVRPPTLFRLRVTRASSPAERSRGPLALEISLSQGDTLLASDFISIGHLGEMREGVTVALAPEALSQRSAEPVVLRISLLNASAPTVGAPFTPMEALTRVLPTPHTLAADLDALEHRMPPSGTVPDLVRLWAEQGQEITQGNASLERCHELERLLALLHGALAGTVGASLRDGPLLAYVDPTDGSVQPERRYLPVLDAGGQAWLLGSPARAPVKSAWPEPDSGLLSGASHAGSLLVQEYPAGDLAWDGIAMLRAQRRLRATSRARVLLIGQGAAALAALRIAAQIPERIAEVRLLDARFGDARPPPLPDAIRVAMCGEADAPARAWGVDRVQLTGAQDPAFWRLAPTAQTPSLALPPALVAPELATALTRYAHGPFVVVVGMGEHRAAQQDNQQLAHRFIAAWAQHAQGLPPCIDDTAFDPRAYRGSAWILIGNPRSNRVIAHLVHGHPLPVSWDSRSLSFQGQHYLRAERRAVALMLPREDGGSAVLLDGAPAWSAQGLPLVGLSEPWVGEPTAMGAPGSGASPSAAPDAPMMARP